MTDGKMTLRDHVLGYTGDGPPSLDEVSAARMWLDATGATETSQGRMGRSDWAACTNLLQAQRRHQRHPGMLTKPRTDPRARSAPLPRGTMVGLPEPSALLAEIERASTELMWGLHRQRQVWAKMEALRIEAEDKGNAWFMDNERPWKLATGDVAWWRGEVSSRSNALSSLVSLAAAMGIRVSGSYVETTSFGEASRGERSWMSS